MTRPWPESCFYHGVSSLQRTHTAMESTENLSASHVDVTNTDLLLTSEKQSLGYPMCKVTGGFTNQ